MMKERRIKLHFLSTKLTRWESINLSEIIVLSTGGSIPAFERITSRSAKFKVAGAGNKSMVVDH